MKLTLSWDLFILVFAVLVVAYSFIIGKKESMKIIVSSYIAVVAVQGIGNLTQRLFGDASSLLGYAGMTVDSSATAIIKIALFVMFIVFLVVRAGLAVQFDEGNILMTAVLTALAGIATAGLLLATLFTYISGAPLLDMNLASAPTLAPIVKQSIILQMFLTYHEAFFAVPAGVLILSGILQKK